MKQLAPKQLVVCIGSIVNYVDSLDEEQRKKVEIIESNTNFKFGDGRQVKSQKRARIPAQIRDKSCLIEMEIVKEKYL